MNDFEAALAPKSDQINSSDLIGGDMTITIVSVKVTPGTEQPVSISFKESAKVWRPCKSTGRVLMAAWGADTAQYAGRSVQLYLDPKVKWGGMEIGGIRISAISHIEDDLKIVLAESKQVRKAVIIKRLATQRDATQDQAAKYNANTALQQATAIAHKGTAIFRDWYNSEDGKQCRATKALTPEAMLSLRDIATAADAACDTDVFGLPVLSDAASEVPTPAPDREQFEYICEMIVTEMESGASAAEVTEMYGAQIDQIRKHFPDLAAKIDAAFMARG